MSEFLRQKLPLELAEQLGESGTVAGRAAAAAGAGGAAAGTPADAAAALSATFLRVDRELCGGSGVSVAYSGSTAVVCMLQGRRLTTAWVGDSRAVLARQVGWVGSMGAVMVISCGAGAAAGWLAGPA